jgi:hypothetical protein
MNEVTTDPGRSRTPNMCRARWHTLAAITNLKYKARASLTHHTVRLEMSISMPQWEQKLIRPAQQASRTWATASRITIRELTFFSLSFQSTYYNPGFSHPCTAQKKRIPFKILCFSRFRGPYPVSHPVSRKRVSHDGSITF